MGILTRIKRIILSFISFGLIKFEDPKVIGPYIMDNMKKKLGELKRSAVPVVASQYRIEQMLAKEQTRLQELDADARQAVLQNEDDIASNLLLQKEACQGRVEELTRQLLLARQHADEAKQQIVTFEEELQTAEDRTRSAQVKYQLATMRAQVQKFAMSPSLDEDVKAIEQMEDRAEQVAAEAQAMGDIAAMGEKSKLQQIRQNARKQRAEAALAELKAEMGLTDTEKRFKKVSVEIGEGQTEQTEEPQVQQQVVGSGEAAGEDKPA